MLTWQTSFALSFFYNIVIRINLQKKTFFCHQVRCPAGDECEDVNHAHPQCDVFSRRAATVLSHRSVSSQKFFRRFGPSRRIERWAATLKNDENNITKIVGKNRRRLQRFSSEDFLITLNVLHRVVIEKSWID